MTLEVFSLFSFWKTLRRMEDNSSSHVWYNCSVEIIGPELFLVDRSLITEPSPLFVIGLLRSPTSPWFGLKMFPEI
jgi:hypothetical protein